jgi:hypothetical protein
MTFAVSKAFFLKFHDIVVNCHGYSEVTTTGVQQEQCVFTVITLLQLHCAIESGMDWGLFKTFVLSTSLCHELCTQ